MRNGHVQVRQESLLYRGSCVIGDLVGELRIAHFKTIDRCDKAVSAACERLDKAWIGRRITQHFANLVHSSVQTVIEIDERIDRPKLLPQVITRNHAPGIFEQYGEDLERLFLQAELDAVLAKFSRA